MKRIQYKRHRALILCLLICCLVSGAFAQPARVSLRTGLCQKLTAPPPAPAAAEHIALLPHHPFIPSGQEADGAPAPQTEPPEIAPKQSPLAPAKQDPSPSAIVDAVSLIPFPPDPPDNKHGAGSKYPLPENAGFQWRPAMRQSFLFLGIQHAFRFATEPGTREELKGPFFRDYFRSVRNVRGWRDGDPFIVNYIGHSMQGAVTGYIQIHNDPYGIRQGIGKNRGYWKSRYRALVWSAVYSTLFEIGPISEASLGNVGRLPSKTSPHPAAWVDLIITPTLGTGWLIGEDALDRWIVRPLERRVNKYPFTMILRGVLAPGRSFTNALRGKWPWYRDDR
ncbi:MAG: hypothetical protein ACKV2V_03595 [Blastocatellia bacterium]